MPTRVAVAQVLSRIGPDARIAYNALFTGVRDDAVGVRVLCLRTLAQIAEIDSSESHPPELPAVNQKSITDGESGEPTQRPSTARSVPYGELITVAIAATEDESIYVRRAAVEVLGAHGAMVPGAPIVARLTDEDPGVRWLAAMALAAPHAGDLTKLEKLLQDPKTDVRAAAAT